MTDFWSLIDGGFDRLQDHLTTCPRSELLAFRTAWQEVDARLFAWPVWDAACVLLGYVSDDFFGDVRAWIISHGEATVDEVAADPDNLADLANDTDAVEDAEELTMMIDSVWRHRFGGEPLPQDRTLGFEPTGDRVDLQDKAAVRARFPRLAALAHSPR